MENLQLMIGEHTIQLQFKSVNIQNMFRRSFPTIQTIQVSQPDLVIVLEDGYGRAFVNYDVLVTKDNRSITYRRADYCIKADLDYGRAKICAHDELALKHAFLNLYSSFIVHNDWGLLLHSSCALEKGKAHLFAGHSGAGKSTAAVLSLPREIFADEAAIVKISAGSVTTFHSPFRSDPQTVNARTYDRPMMLGSIQLLQQSLQNQRLKLSKSDGLLQLMDKVFYWSASQEEMRKVFTLLKALVNLVPVYHLFFQKNPSFWELIS